MSKTSELQKWVAKLEADLTTAQERIRALEFERAQNRSRVAAFVRGWKRTDAGLGPLHIAGWNDAVEVVAQKILEGN
jgi:hypothetical protein